MSARKLSQSNLFDNQQASGQASEVRPNLLAARSVIFAAIAKIAEKEGRRDEIPDGYAGPVELLITAKVDGVIYREGYDSQLSVGHRSVRNSSVNPDMGQVLALVLGKLNAATREKILAELPEEYAAAGGELPEADKAIEAAADGMLAKMRGAKQVSVRGSVSVKYQASQPALSLVG